MQTIAIEYRHSGGRDELLPRLAAELVDLKVNETLGLTIPQSLLLRADEVIQ